MSRSSDRVGAKLVGGRGRFDCIDVTQLVSGWFTSNHYYLKNPFFKLDLIQALSKVGGVDPKYRNYVLPVYSKETTNDSGLLSDRVAYHELVDKPYMKVVPEQKQNANQKKDAVLQEAKEEEVQEAQMTPPEEEDAKQAEPDRDDVAANLKIIQGNLRAMGYSGMDDEEAGDVDLENIEVR